MVAVINKNDFFFCLTYWVFSSAFYYFLHLLCQSSDFFFFFFKFMAALGLHCCAWAFSSCGERGPLFIAVCWFLIAVASPAAEHWL